MNMFLWTTFVDEDLFPVFSELRECGYEGLEIPIVRGDIAHYQTIRQALDDNDLLATGVTFVSADQDPLSDDQNVRQRGVDHIAWACEAALALGAKILCGPIHAALGEFSGAAPTDDQRRRSAEVLGQMGEVAQAAGVVLAVEYLNRFESYLTNTAADTDALVRACAHPAVRSALDTHHAHIEEQSLSAAVAAMAETLVHVQLSESHRGVPGTGQVDWDGFLDALRSIGYEGWLMVESFSRQDPDFAAAVNIWRDLAPNAEAVWRGGFEFLAPKLR